MPHSIGIRELKNQVSRILKVVREEKAEYVVTLKGEPVAMLKPFTDNDALHIRQSEIDEELAEMKTLAKQIAQSWQSSKSGIELLDEQRR